MNKIVETESVEVLEDNQNFQSEVIESSQKTTSGLSPQSDKNKEEFIFSTQLSQGQPPLDYEDSNDDQTPMQQNNLYYRSQLPLEPSLFNPHLRFPPPPYIPGFFGYAPFGGGFGVGGYGNFGGSLLNGPNTPNQLNGGYAPVDPNTYQDEEMAPSKPGKKMGKVVGLSGMCKKFSITSQQKEVLEKEFEHTNYPPKRRQEELSRELGVKQSKIYNWFQNRRARKPVADMKVQYQAEIKRLQNELTRKEEEVKRLQAILVSTGNQFPMEQAQPAEECQPCHSENLYSMFMEGPPETQRNMPEDSPECHLSQEAFMPQEHPPQNSNYPEDDHLTQIANSFLPTAHKNLKEEKDLVLPMIPPPSKNEVLMPEQSSNVNVKAAFKEIVSKATAEHSKEPMMQVEECLEEDFITCVEPTPRSSTPVNQINEEETPAPKERRRSTRNSSAKKRQKEEKPAQQAVST